MASDFAGYIYGLSHEKVISISHRPTRSYNFRHVLLFAFSLSNPAHCLRLWTLLECIWTLC